ncbi:hypothetical protein KHP57_04795 [Algiphilus sp. NNCM1]|uniref:hypothetical protein n=1 Tax=Algiphilus sp. TaxID=1872431 RepID=UPI001CA79B2D|nr:hypothetical protein [Algiphilus sp.]MBY8965015.1 hypothetical protein [Algiphilus acroporae]MCI5104171.1 hypothetical protein [Algiphilus sp.]
MNHLSTKAFHHLIFPLHHSILQEVDAALGKLMANDPALLDLLTGHFKQVFDHPTDATLLNIAPDSGQSLRAPAFDIYVFHSARTTKKVHKAREAQVRIRRHDASYAGMGCHLILMFEHLRPMEAFIVPLALTLKPFEHRVCRPHTQQVYEHAFFPAPAGDPRALTRKTFLRGSATYVGMTSRAWQQRFQEHRNAARRGSQLRVRAGLSAAHRMPPECLIRPSAPTQ